MERASPGRDAGRSRVTAVLRLALALWLMASAGQTLSDPPRAAAERGAAVAVLLPLAGLSFALGAFLLTGFMSRLAGLLLAGLAVWELLALGPDPGPALLAGLGLYLALRGGGAWAMDVYVQHMQDRVRRRAAARRSAS